MPKNRVNDLLFSLFVLLTGIFFATTLNCVEIFFLFGVILTAANSVLSGKPF
jgi:hypothetical protein